MVWMIPSASSARVTVSAIAIGSTGAVTPDRRGDLRVRSSGEVGAQRDQCQPQKLLARRRLWMPEANSGKRQFVNRLCEPGYDRGFLRR